ncbi:unnamed protein product [Angiostrongylus costaricensis]|uniref:S ribonuclease n=1 Tax=Angiostrongylus costaricensis TaxID=334426 RepID=A0A0R3PFL0_ANGCS|nr:unnamed protein product [Angiostrongylus costaricensis]
MDCKCKQRCREAVHEVTFSASKWPSGATDVRMMSTLGSVFYEQLNYELLQESEAYGLVNLIADFGGHLGLWLGTKATSYCHLLLLVYFILFDSSSHLLCGSQYFPHSVRFLKGTVISYRIKANDDNENMTSSEKW